MRHASVTALAVTFSNTVLLGIPLVKLAFGDPGLVYGIAKHWRAATILTVLKNVAFPLVSWAIARFGFDLSGIALAVVTVTAALPMGANVFLFAQR